MTALSTQPVATPSAIVTLGGAAFVATAQDVETYGDGAWTTIGSMTGKISSLAIDPTSGDLYAVNETTSAIMAYRGSDWSPVAVIPSCTALRVDTSTTPATLWVLANSNLVTLPSDGSAPPLSALGNILSAVGSPNLPVFGRNAAFAAAADGVWFSVSRGR